METGGVKCWVRTERLSQKEVLTTTTPSVKISELERLLGRILCFISGAIFGQNAVNVEGPDFGKKCVVRFLNMYEVYFYYITAVVMHPDHAYINE